MPQAIHISPIDNVVVALHPIAKGTLVEVDGLAVTALEDIPQGHKMAVRDFLRNNDLAHAGNLDGGTLGERRQRNDDVVGRIDLDSVHYKES